MTAQIPTPSGSFSLVRVFLASPSDLRNLAISHAMSGNDELALEAHDANLIYGSRGTLDLSRRELNGLADAGLATEYVLQDYRFYNVIRWLDLALAFDTRTAKSAAVMELKTLLRS